jgi:lysophospholipase L1-like esterase
MAEAYRPFIYGTVLCLGDSLTYGARGSRGYPEILPDLLNSGSTNWSTLNRGISAETTRDILLRTPGAVRELASLPGAKWCVILAGTNDSKSDGLDINTWCSLYRQIVSWPRRHGIPTILCTMPPVVPAEMPCFTRASQAWIDDANMAIREFVREFNCNPSPVALCDLADMPEGMPEYMLVDGVHCTMEGYHFIAERVAKVIRSAE